MGNRSVHLSRERETRTDVSVKGRTHIVPPLSDYLLIYLNYVLAMALDIRSWSILAERGGERERGREGEREERKEGEREGGRRQGELELTFPVM